MSLNTVPTDYHEFEYSKLSVFKLKFMTTGRIHAERWRVPRGGAARARGARGRRTTKRAREREIKLSCLARVALAHLFLALYGSDYIHALAQRPPPHRGAGPRNKIVFI